MNTTKQSTVIHPTGIEIYRRSIARGLKCYRIAPLWNFLWIPWDKKVIFILDTKEIKRFFGLRTKNDLFDFCWHCTNNFEYLYVPAPILEEHPVPDEEPGCQYLDTTVLMAWAQKVLSISTQKKGITNEN